MKKLIKLFLTIMTFSQLIYGDISWDLPIVISTAGQNASDPHVVMDSNGNIIAVWIENGFVKSSSMPINGSWKSPTILSDSGASSPKLSIDSSGNTTAVWVENGIVNSSMLPFNGSWGAEVALSDMNGGASAPGLSVDITGNAVAVWVRNGNIESATMLFGKTWGAVNVLSSTGSDSPSVAIGANGTVVAVWHSIVSGLDMVMYATSSINGSWASAKSILSESSSNSHNYPHIAVDSEGNAISVWYCYNQSGATFSNVQVLTATLTVGGSSWSTPQVLSKTGMRDPSQLAASVGFDSNRNASILWTNSYDGSLFTIEAAAKPPSLENFIGPSALALQNLYAFQVDKAITSIGQVVIGYMIADNNSVIIESTETELVTPVSTLNVFLPPTMISTDGENGYPRVAATSSGNVINAVAVWINSNGVNNVIEAATGSKNVINPPTNVTATQASNNLGVFTEYYNTITWEASSDPDVMFYNIYRDGEYWTFVDSDTFEVVDHNAPQSGKQTTTYGVAAVTRYFFQSQIINFSL